MHARRLVLWTLLACLAACGDLKVQSVPPTVVVPVELEGRWVGTWQSEQTAVGPVPTGGSGPTGGSVPTGGSGSIELRIQEFAGKPLVALTIDNPCLVPRNYDLRLTAVGIDLLADGISVLHANHAADQRLVGTYQCDEDHGVWTAVWVESLPTLLDLSGTWYGRIFGPGQPEQPIEVTMTQRVEGGALVLVGQADLPGALPFGLPMRGYVRFREAEFELVLQTQQGFEPQVIVAGLGDREPLQVPLGFVQVLSSTALPFTEGMIELVRTVPGQ